MSNKTNKSKSEAPAGSLARTGWAAGALAEGVWSAAKERELMYEDIIGACAILVESVSRNSGEPLDYLLSEIDRRAKMVKPPNRTGSGR